MIKFPLWIAKNENKIVIYDSNLKQIYSCINTPTIEKKIKEIVNLCNKYRSIIYLKDI
jgi:hypothetical protein